MPTAVSLTNTPIIPVFTAENPCEGPILLSLFLDFTANQSYVVDGKPLTDKQQMSMLQTVYADSTGCTTNLIIDVDRSQQRIICKPNTEGYYPIIAPNPFRVTFTCTTGPSGIHIMLLNAPIAPFQWATA